MRTLVFTLLSIFILSYSPAQNGLYTRNAMHPQPSIELKWYTQELLTPEGVDVYRKLENFQWQKISKAPIRFGDLKPSTSELSSDPDLKKYLTLVDNSKNMKGMLLLASVLKSFSSLPLSRYLGIYFIDSTVTYGASYSYRINKAGSEIVLATSAPITSKNYVPISSPQQIKWKTDHTSILFKWLPEPTRYFGLNIFRKTNSQKEYTKINRDPIMLSEHKDSSNKTTLPKWLFEDRNLMTGETYYYQFEAIDLFGSPSLRTETFEIYVKDRQSPKPPDSLWYNTEGKKITIHWKKENPEKDLTGFNIYRTTKNDTDYTKLNRELLLQDTRTFNDVVPEFGSYMYMVSCVDKDSNEAKSNGLLVNAFDNDPPSVPRNVKIIADSGKIMISWDPNTEKDLRGYYVYRTINSDDKNRYVKLTPTTFTGTEFTDPLPVNAKNRFLYKVCAVDKSLNRSGYCEPVSIRMPDVTAPSRPFLKTVVFNEKNDLVLEWFRNAEPDLASYEILRRNADQDSNQFESINAKPISPLVTKFTDRHTSAGVYEYAIKAIDSTGNRSTLSNVLCINVKNKVPSTQCSLEFSCEYNTKKEKVELKWKPEGAEKLLGFVLFRLHDQENTMTPLTGCVTAQAFFDQQVTKNSTYTYQVRAYLPNGDVFHSKRLTITTK